MPDAQQSLVLVIDDEESLREVIKAGLEVIGDFTVEMAVDGEDGLRKIVELQPDTVFLDMLMPGIDGFEVLARIRDGESTVRPDKIVAMSGFVDPASVKRMESLGASRILPKPFSLQQLRDAQRD